MSKDEELDRRDGRKVEVEQSAKETMNTSNSGLYHEVTNSSWERCNPSGLRLVVKNDAFYGNYRRNIGRRSGKAV